MYYVYILKSQKNGRRYIGFTSKDPKKRLKEHNSGSSIYTRSRGPYEIIYFEGHADESFARKRERYFKTGNGRKYLKNFIPL